MNTQKATLTVTAIAAWFTQAVYTLSPIDLIPDFIPILGLVDDLFGLILVILFTTFVIYRLVKDPQRLKHGPSQAKKSANYLHPEDAPYQPLSMEEIRAL